MNPLPFVSVVINNYNYATFLGSAIDSALDQTYPHVEVIVVDDGSTDDSPAIMARYTGRIIGFRQPHRGQAAAVNAGFARAVGDVVIFLDSDDLLLPDIVEKVAAIFRDAPDLARVQYRLAVVGRDGTGTGESIPSTDSLMPSGDRRQELAQFNNYAWWPPMTGNAFSARTLRSIMPMPEEPFWLAADYYLVRAATLCGPIRSLDEVGAHYRMHGANAYLSSGLDLEQTRTQIRLINDAHDVLKQFAAKIRFDNFPSSASDAWDLRFFALRMASLRLDPAGHPLPGDGLLFLARRGVTAALRQTQRTVAFRCAAAAWFAAMILSPRGLGWSFADWFFFPANRPRVAWARVTSPKVVS
jgi:glycosyltransferase involved in cell wall biosynthesis